MEENPENAARLSKTLVKQGYQAYEWVVKARDSIGLLLITNSN